MLDLALKDVRRHKARSFLTVLGIIIAIGAIVSLGSISSGMNDLVQKQLKMMGSLMTLEEEGAVSTTGPPSGQVSLEDLKEIEQISGVEEVSPMILKQSGSMMIAGVDFEKMEFVGLEDIEVKDGDWPDAGDYKLVVGHYIAENQDVDIGDYVRIEGEDLEVSGVLEEMASFMDYVMITSLETVQDIYDDTEYVTQAFLKLENLGDAGKVEEEIEDLFPSIDARTTEDNVKRANETIGQVRLLTLAIGFIAAIVAAIGIINTMFMSVTEKKRQIGIMKATGAIQRQIIYDVLQEGVILAVIGGVVGILIGFMGTGALNRMMGMPMAKVTPALALGSFAFGVILTVGASMYPAIQASKIDPIEAIRGG